MRENKQKCFTLLGTEGKIKTKTLPAQNPAPNGRSTWTLNAPRLHPFPSCASLAPDGSKNNGNPS